MGESTRWAGGAGCNGLLGGAIGSAFKAGFGGAEEKRRKAEVRWLSAGDPPDDEWVLLWGVVAG
jgi:hypothetical protein